MSQQINLFNPIFLKQKTVFTAVPMAEALGVIVAGALLLDWYAGRQVAELERSATAGKTQLTDRETRLGKATTQFAPRAKSPALAQDVAQAEVELKALHDVESVLKGGALGNTAGYSEYFRALSRQNVSGLWLTGVTIVGAGNDIGVQGRALQPTMIPNYIARLTSESVLRGKTFASLNISRPAAMASMAAVAPVPEPISPQLAQLAGIAGGKAGDKKSAAAAAASAAAAAPAATPASSPSAPVASVSPFVEFSLQTTAVEAAK